MAVGQLAEKTEKISDALSVDFCPWANKYVYWLKNPFWTLLLAFGGSIVCGIFLNPLVFVLAGLLAAVVGIGVALPWLSMRTVSAKVVFDVPRTRIRTPALIRLNVRNQSPFPVWGLSVIRGFAQDNKADTTEGLSLARVPGMATVEYSWAFEPVRRGLYPDDTIEVETGFPFGLYRAGREVDTEGQLIVWPKTVRLEGMPDASDSKPADDDFSERRVGEFGDMMGTRLFRDGDSLRRVHWAQTARQQTMVVTERQAPAMASVRVVLDLSEASHSGANPKQTVELAVSIAASVCESLHRQHSRVELILNGKTYTAGEAVAGYNALMDALAVAQPVPGKLEDRSTTGFEILITTDVGRRPVHSRQIIVGETSGSSWLNVRDEASLQTQLPQQWKGACHGT